MSECLLRSPLSFGQYKYNIWLEIAQTNRRYYYGYLLCSSCCRFVLFCYERDFILSLSDNNQADVVEAFNSISRYLDDLLNFDDPYF